MANPFGKIEDRIPFDWREVAIALVKHKGIHEGLWRAGTNIDRMNMIANVTSPAGAMHKRPACLMIIDSLDIHQMTKETADELTIDAAVENPRPRLVHVLH